MQNGVATLDDEIVKASTANLVIARAGDAAGQLRFKTESLDV